MNAKNPTNYIHSTLSVVRLTSTNFMSYVDGWADYLEKYKVTHNSIIAFGVNRRWINNHYSTNREITAVTKQIHAV